MSVPQNFGRRRSFGFTVIEVLVGCLIALFSVIAVFTVYQRFEGTTRGVKAVNETQLEGALVLMTVEHLVSNAGTGIMNHKRALDQCPTGADAVYSGSSAMELLLRAAPVVIDEQVTTPSGGAATSLSLFYSTTHLYPALLQAQASADGRSLKLLQTPFGFRKNNVVITIAPGKCLAYRIDNNVDADDKGTTTLMDSSAAFSPDTESAVDIGQGSRTRIYLDDDNVLRMQTLTLSDASSNKWQVARDEALAANVMGFYAQYGIDSNGDKTLDTWTPAIGAWDAARLAQDDSTTLGKILAVRVGVFMKSNEPGGKGDGSVTLSLFDKNRCLAGMTCPDTITRTFANTDGLNWRYRAFETVIPLRSVLWDAPHILTASSTPQPAAGSGTGEKP